MTVQQLVNLSALDSGLIRSGQTPSTQESSDGLATLNHILSSWSLERLSVHTILHATFSLAAATESYTMGPAATWATTLRPVKILSAEAYSGQFRAGLEVLPLPEFRRRAQNPTGIRQSLPDLLAHDNTATTITVFVFPLPNATISIDVDYWTVLTAFALLGDAISMNPGYELALRKALAVEMCSWQRITCPPDLAAAAQNSKAAIVSLNATILGEPAAAVPQQ